MLLLEDLHADWFHLSHLFWTSSSVNLLQNWKFTQKLCFCHSSNHLEKLHLTHLFAMCNLYIYIYYNGLILHAWQLILFELAETQCLLTLTEWLAFCKMCADQPAKEWWLDRGSCLCQVRNGVDLLGTLLITAVSCFPIQLVFHDLNWLLCSVFLFFFISVLFFMILTGSYAVCFVVIVSVLFFMILIGSYAVCFVVIVSVLFFMILTGSYAVCFVVIVSVWVFDGPWWWSWLPWWLPLQSLVTCKWRVSTFLT